MMSREALLGKDFNLCELCRRQRPGMLRVFGVGWIGHYWACEACIEIYRELVAGEGGRS